MKRCCRYKEFAVAKNTGVNVKKKSRFLLGIILAMLLVIGSLTGCSSSSDNETITSAKAVIYESYDESKNIGSVLDAAMPDGKWSSGRDDKNGIDFVYFKGKDDKGKEWQITFQTKDGDDFWELGAIMCGGYHCSPYVEPLKFDFLVQSIYDGNFDFDAAEFHDMSEEEYAISIGGDTLEAYYDEQGMKSLKEAGIDYGYNTALANGTAGLIDAISDESTTVTLIDGGLRFIDNHTDMFPVSDPGIEYFKNVDFNTEKRVIDKYPNNDYSLMHVIGCVNEIMYDTSLPDLNNILGTDGITYFDMSGFCNSSNSYEEIIGYFYGDLSFVYNGSSVMMLATPIATVNDTSTGESALVVLVSFVATVDDDYSNQIVYGQTEGEYSMDLFMGGWYIPYMSVDKMKEETVRLGKEKLGYSADSTDADISPDEFDKTWLSADNSNFLMIRTIDSVIKSESYSQMMYSEGTEGYNYYESLMDYYRSLKGDYQYHVNLDVPDLEGFGNLNGNKIDYVLEDGTYGSIWLSFSMDSSSPYTLASDWLSDKSASMDGLYLHYSIDGTGKSEYPKFEYEFESQEADYYEIGEENNYSYDLTDTSEWMLPYSDCEYVDIGELSDMFVSSDYRLAINEIYARHGRIFKSEDLDRYFRNCSWYEPTYTADQWEQMGGDNYFFNEYEKANIAALQEAQARLGKDDSSYNGIDSLYDNATYVWVINCNESITLRAEPNTNAAELTQIPKYSSVTYLGQANSDFFMIEYNGKTGYALSSYLDFFEPQVYTGITYRVANCKDYITLRSTPKTTGQEIVKIPLGATIDFLEKHGEFYLINYNGQVGYALASYLF